MQFYNLYADFDNFNATQIYSDMQIEKAIVMHEGDSIPGFPSFDVFIYLIQPQLEKLREPALDLLQDIYGQLESLAGTIVDKIFQRFPSMIPVIMEIIIAIFQKERDHARNIVESIIDAEISYFFTNDRDYKENRTDIVPNEDRQITEHNQSTGGQNPAGQQ